MFGEIRSVSNKNAAPSASIVYHAICVINEHGEQETLLLTARDLERVRSRAKKNPEDLITLTWLQETVLWIVKSLKLL
tara:strand:- start:232 stop:465 length:234 start_codon:yes stop_codon:yes gene_type:complete